MPATSIRVSLPATRSGSRAMLIAAAAVAVLIAVHSGARALEVVAESRLAVVRAGNRGATRTVSALRTALEGGSGRGDHSC